MDRDAVLVVEGLRTTKAEEVRREERAVAKKVMVVSVVVRVKRVVIDLEWERLWDESGIVQSTR